MEIDLFVPAGLVCLCNALRGGRALSFFFFGCTSFGTVLLAYSRLLAKMGLLLTNTSNTLVLISKLFFHQYENIVFVLEILV